MILEYYNSLFLSNVDTRHEELMHHVNLRVIKEMNEILIKEFTSEEIKHALDCIGNLKAPGIDGMPALFYKEYWHIVGDDICREVRNFLSGGNMPSDWNKTVLVIIPKVPNPEKLRDLRPISLCNVIYKIASKVLANRLKIILPDIILSTKVCLSEDV